MAKIGVILAGCANKGAYEIGCLRAIEEYFGTESIVCISSASMGTLVAQAHGRGRVDDLQNLWKSIDTKRHGRFIPTLSGSEDIVSTINSFVATSEDIRYEHYTSIWNYTQRKVEYIPLHELSGERLNKYLHAAISIPFFSKGETIDGDLLLDGAFLDNIPVFPLLDKDIDYIFCVYFDNCRYFFENEEFDKKLIKIYDFPNRRRFETLAFNPENIDDMAKYAYDYTMNTINKIFVHEDREEIYKAIAEREKNLETTFKARLTVDTVLDNINVMTKRYSKRITSRIKKNNND